MVKRLALLCCMIVATLNGFSQKDSIQIQVMFSTNSDLLDNGETVLEGNDFSIEKCRFYLSNFSFYDGDSTLISTQQAAQLVDLNDKESHLFKVACAKGAAFFSVGIGIDSLTNVSGVFGVELDPTNGMYWSWQSGYINIKIEGEVKEGDNHSFAYHLGGYNPPFASYQTTRLFPLKTELVVRVNVEEFIEKTKNLNTDKVMRPGKEAAELSRYFVTSIHVQ